MEKVSAEPTDLTQAPDKLGLLATGGLIGALLASTCCIAPLALVMLGVGSAWVGNLTALAPYQWLFLLFAAGCLGAGMRATPLRLNKAKTMDVQFLAFSGCPLAVPARENLKNALADCGMSDFEEVDILDPASPEELRGWGSPTILVNGSDVTGLPKGHSVSCRVYPFPGGVPDVESILDGLKAATE